ncbi:cysteine-rich receptor-like protein kinase 44 [Mercurialis annua]|uniref:cysteine-rich receptor-like protein kinase 44 n=1 Tax=Mercurialis annua TaxID=3986 RepID=UPI00215DF1A7|nr:cysteine-rich receptor-like protein kinase 44 [Mercurialis annua]
MNLITAMMRSLTPLIFSSFVVLQLAFVAVAQPQFMHQTCYDNGYYTANSTYRTDLNTVLSSLVSDTKNDSGFYNLTVGQVNSIAFCRGDVKPEDCRGCVANATRQILQICPNQTDAIGVYDRCRLRYRNSSIYGVVDVSRIFTIWNGNNASNLDEFIQAQQTLFRRLRSETASGNSVLKFATGNEAVGFDEIYGMMQCSPDLSPQRCDECLSEVISYIINTFSGKIAVSSIAPSCDVRFDNKLFYDPSVATSPPPPAPQESPVPELPPPPPPEPSIKGNKSNTTKTIIVIVVPIIGVVVIFSIGLFVFFKKQKPKREADENVDEIENPESLQLDFETVRIATDNFCEENKLGQGGFGAVYKGLLSNGQEIAVKRLSKNSGQGDLEFKTEVVLVAKLQHRNLVRLLGFSLAGEERLLIYEFVPNGSLDHLLFDPRKRGNLDWKSRYRIISGIARGLLYLHEDSQLRIIHRDLKASNILLDVDLNPKIADFGMARLFEMDQTQGNTNRIVGTFGYMAPEYAMHGFFSVKSDVYSFGVLLLEIVSGQMNSSFADEESMKDLLSYAWKNWKEGTSIKIIDPSLKSGLSNEVIRCIQIGLLCVQENVADRPSMATVVLMLNSYSTTLSVPSQPAFFMQSHIESEFSSSWGYKSER